MTFKTLLAIFWSGCWCSLLDASSLTRLFAEPRGVRIWLVLLQERGAKILLSRETSGTPSSLSSLLVKVLGLQMTRNHFWSTHTERGLLARSQVVLSVWEAGERHSEQGQEFKEAELAGIRARSRPWNSLERVSLLLPLVGEDWTLGAILGTAATAILAAGFILNGLLRLCVTGCGFSWSPSDSMQQNQSRKSPCVQSWYSPTLCRCHPRLSY